MKAANTNKVKLIVQGHKNLESVKVSSETDTDELENEDLEQVSGGLIGLLRPADSIHNTWCDGSVKAAFGDGSVRFQK